MLGPTHLITQLMTLLTMPPSTLTQVRTEVTYSLQDLILSAFVMKDVCY